LSALSPPEIIDAALRAGRRRREALLTERW
jgi:hypothetical protein